MILMVGYSVEMLASLAGVVPPGAVVVAEEPDVARVRALHEAVAGIAIVSGLVECEYQVPGALVRFLDGAGLRPAAVVPGIEYAVEAAASAAAHLALPGAGVEAAAVFRDKHRLRHLAGAAGLRNPRHALVASPAEAAAFWARAGRRCVLKPTTRQGSLGVQYVESAAQIEAGWAMTSAPEGGAVIPARGIASLVLAEEAVPGPEFSVEMLLSRRVPRFVNVTAKHLFPGRFPVERGHDVPAPVPGEQAALLAAATATLAAAAGVSDALLHAEWITDDDGPVLVECAARAPGGRIAELIRLAYGFPLIPAYLDVMLGKPSLAGLPSAGAVRGAAIRYLTAPPGVVAAVAGADEAAGMPGVTEVRIRARAGDVVRPLTVSGNRLGYVLAQGEDPLDAAANAEAAAGAIQIQVLPGPLAGSVRTMGARNGTEFLERLSAARVHVEVMGETLTGGIARHPAFRNVVRSYAELYDMQHDPAYRDVLTYPSPSSGDPVATSFLVPRTPRDLDRRFAAFRLWADRGLGMLGRTGDYLNSALMALGAASSWFAQAGQGFGENIARYYEMVREQDLLCTHTLVPPQANRAVTASQQAGGALMAHIVREDDNGIVIRGARLLATIGPFADELLVFPSTVLRGTPEDKPYSFACAVPGGAPGLRYLCREPLDYGRPRHDHPLGSRFEEPDAVVIFDDVHVPYERCFVLGDPDLCNDFYTRTCAVAHMTHQVLARTTAKTEYILGLVSLLTEAIGIERFQHVQGDVAEVITTLETLRAFAVAAHAGAAANEFGVLTPAWPPLNAARNLYPKLYQRFPEILRKLGASGLMALPTEADVTGPAAADIAAYLQSATLTGAERVRLFRLVWDTCASAFAGRQALYEYYFFGDPVRMAGAYVASYDREPYKTAVRAFLAPPPHDHGPFGPHSAASGP